MLACLLASSLPPFCAVLPSLQTRLSSLLTTFYAYNIDGWEKEKGIEWAREREMKEREGGRNRVRCRAGPCFSSLAISLTWIRARERLLN